MFKGGSTTPGEGIQINLGGGRFANDLSFFLNVPIKIELSVPKPPGPLLDPPLFVTALGNSNCPLKEKEKEKKRKKKLRDSNPQKKIQVRICKYRYLATGLLGDTQ